MKDGFVALRPTAAARSLHPAQRAGRLLLGAALLLAAAPLLAQSSVVVVAHKGVPVEKIDAGQATQIFLRQLSTWPDGARIQPIDLSEGNPLRAEFYSRITGRSAGQLRAYWARQAFTGMGLPPRELATVEEVSRAVQSTPGAIGYVDRKSADANVKIVLDPDR